MFSIKCRYLPSSRHCHEDSTLGGSRSPCSLSETQNTQTFEFPTLPSNALKNLHIWRVTKATMSKSSCLSKAAPVTCERLDLSIYSKTGCHAKKHSHFCAVLSLRRYLTDRRNSRCLCAGFKKSVKSEGGWSFVSTQELKHWQSLTSTSTHASN